MFYQLVRLQNHHRSHTEPSLRTCRPAASRKRCTMNSSAKGLEGPVLLGNCTSCHLRHPKTCLGFETSALPVLHWLEPHGTIQICLHPGHRAPCIFNHSLFCEPSHHRALPQATNKNCAQLGSEGSNHALPCL